MSEYQYNSTAGHSTSGLSEFDLPALASALRESIGIGLKEHIQVPARWLSHEPPAAGREDASIRIGDDAAAIPDASGHILLAAEGMLGDFVEDDPWFAGWSAVMANVSDVASMGGTPLAVVDVYWHNESSQSELVFAGLRAAASAFGVPVVGGHTGYSASGPHALAVAIVGRSDHPLLTSFDGRPGQTILTAIDLRGGYRREKPFWNAATDAPPERLRGDIALLAELARLGIVEACKDISMGGVVGTLLMLLEASGCGATIDPMRVPRPESEHDLTRWLQAFPSFGYLLCVEPENEQAVIDCFVAREIDCQAIGKLDATSRLELECGCETSVLWDLDQRALTGFGAAQD